MGQRAEQDDAGSGRAVVPVLIAVFGWLVSPECPMEQVAGCRYRFWRPGEGHVALRTGVALPPGILAAGSYDSRCEHRRGRALATDSADWVMAYRGIAWGKVVERPVHDNRRIWSSGGRQQALVTLFHRRLSTWFGR